MKVQIYNYFNKKFHVSLKSYNFQNILSLPFLGISDESIINNGNEGITNEEAKKLVNDMVKGMTIDYQKKFNMDKEDALFLNPEII